MNEQSFSEIQRKPFDEILQNFETVEFVRDLFKNNYKKFFVGHEEEVEQMVEQAWERLRSQTGMGSDRLNQTVLQINEEIFHKQNPEFWFNSMYGVYKSTIKPQRDFLTLQPYIKGSHILDYGSGGGYFANVMANNGYRVSTTDILDYRVEEAKHLPFKSMDSPIHIPFLDNSFDTTIIKTVLHHIDPENLPLILQELRRVSQRLIIEEDTFNLPPNIPNLDECLHTQPQLRKFMSIHEQEQLRSIMLIDYFSNAIAQGIVEMNFPFQFKSPPAWKELLESNGFDVNETKLFGFKEGNVTPTCHVLFIADKV